MLLLQREFEEALAFEPEEYDLLETRRPGVLVVAPDGFEREELARDLTSEGFDVWTATDENEAIWTFLCHALEVDALLIDADSLGMSACVLARRVKAFAPNTGCVFQVANPNRRLADPLLQTDALVAKSAPFREVVDFLWESLAFASWAQ